MQSIKQRYITTCICIENKLLTKQGICNTCNNKVLSSQKYCRKCASYNVHYDRSHDYNSNNSKVKRSEPTKYSLQLAKALYSMGIEITLEPEIWYTSCNFYTPDLLVKDEVIIEVDGPIHEDPQIQKKDRIRQRALENSGYTVYRFKNQEIIDSLEDVTKKIKEDILIQPRYSNSVNPRIIEIDVSDADRMSNVSDNFIKSYATALNSTLTIEKWNGSYFKEFLSKYDPTPISNRCAMEKIIFVLLGLNLSSKHDDDNNNSFINFEHFAMLFDKSIGIMNELFGKVAELELKNAYNITATNFMKNLIFYGKPRVTVNRLVLIRNYESIVSHINNFNRYFHKFGIAIEESDVKDECLGELEKIEKLINERKKIKQRIDNHEISNLELKRFGWVDKWMEEAKSLHWLSEWLGHKKFE